MKDSLTEEAEKYVTQKVAGCFMSLLYLLNGLKIIIRLLLDIRDKLDNPERLPYIDVDTDL